MLLYNKPCSVLRAEPGAEAEAETEMEMYLLQEDVDVILALDLSPWE